MKRISDFFLSSKVLSLCNLNQRYLLIGEGSNLSIYDKNENLFKNTIKVFATSNIHGIKVRSQCGESVLVLVWGQKSFIIVSIDVSKFHWEYAIKEYQIQDWIVDAAFADDLSVLFVTAHNTVILCSLILLLSLKKKIDFINHQNLVHIPDVPVTLPEKYILKSKHCSENSLLYCGNITGNSWENFIIFGGTVFGTVHIWAPGRINGSGNEVMPLKSFKSSNGAIFSIDYQESNKLIATTSDDRNVHVWKVDFGESIDSTLPESDKSHLFWEKCQLHSVFCSYGHSARVWRCLILQDGSVVSCGEDSSICHWNKQGALISSWIAHPHSSVWSLCIDGNVLYSGGNDGSIKRWKINCSSSVLIQLPFIAEDCVSNRKGTLLSNENKSCPKAHSSQTNDLNSLKNQSLRCINLINESTILVVCNSGKVWVINVLNKIWKEVFSHPLLKGYCVATTNPDSTFICFGTLSGFLIILNTGTWQCIAEQSVSNHKIQTAIFCNQETLVISSSCGNIQSYRCVPSHDKIELESDGTYILPSCRQRWINCATTLDRVGSELSSILVVGDTAGHVYAYSKGHADPFSKLKFLHGRNGVTSLVTWSDFVVTTGRDGHVRYLILSEDSLICVHSIHLGVGSWISGLMNVNSKLLAVAFSGSKLCLYNIDEEKVVDEVECGGGHRSWDLLVGNERISRSGELSLVSVDKNTQLNCSFLKDGFPMLWQTSISENILPPLKDPTSGREIMCLELMEVGMATYVLFGGEDTLLHVHALEEHKLSRLNSVKSHLSGIRCIKNIIPLEEHAFNPGSYFLSCGGRSEMKVWKVFCPPDASLQHENAPLSGPFPSIYMNPVASHMLKPDSDRNKAQDLDAEVRYMDCLSFWIDRTKALFVLASSDGFLRFFEFSIDDNSFSLFLEVDCCFCLLRLCRVRMICGDYIVASNTRGSIFIWNLKDIIDGCLDRNSNSFDSLEDKFEPVEFAIQKSGVNSLTSSASMKSNSNAFLASGADDGCVHLLELSENCVSQRINKLRLRIQTLDRRCLHASQVSGIAWLSCSEFCSASVDQRIIFWKVDREVLVPLSVVFSSIPDIHGIALLKSRNNQNNSDTIREDESDKLFVCGNGLQIFKIEL